MPPKGCQHYADLSEMPWDIQKSVSCIIRFRTLGSLIPEIDIIINASASFRNMTMAYG